MRRSEVKKPPIASLSVSSSKGYVPFNVSFDIGGHDSDGHIILWTLDLDNDGIPDFGGYGNELPKTINYTYNVAGSYTVSLMVVDNDGLAGWANISLTVVEMPGQDGDQEWQPEYGIKYKVHVVSVIDGDTFDAEFPNRSIERVRMIGVDCPEKTADKNKPNEYDGIDDMNCLAYWGLKAENFTISWLQNKDVYIEFDSSAGFKEYYGRWLCYVYYVYVDDIDFNAELVKEGYARVYEEGD